MKVGFCYSRYGMRVGTRFYSTIPISPKSSLKVPLPAAVASRGDVIKGPSIIDKTTKITTLSNGLRVASQSGIGSHCALGAIIQSGPRYEATSISGISHFIEKLGFHSTDVFIDRNAIQEAMEKCNSIFDCQISRDFIIYAISGFNKHVDKLVNILSETVLRANITNEEMDMARRSISFESQAMQMHPPVEPILYDLLHSAAYGGNNTLGLPRYCPEENLDHITRDHILKFIATYYKPEKMVIAASGVEHDAFVEVVEKHFVPTIPRVAFELDGKNIPQPDNSVAQYTGGYLKIEQDLARYHAPMPEFAYAVLGLESCGYNSPHFVTSCLLHSLLGGGGSFSAGGPGKGMYSRLYLNILNEFHWVNSAQAENHAYTDSGLFSVIGSSSPDSVDRLVQVLINELRRTCEQKIYPEELARAKCQLQSMLLMNLETRVVNFEDIARQVLNTGQRREPEYWVDCINAVKVTDVQDLLHRMLYESALTLVGFGKVTKLPSLKDVSSALLNEPIKTNSRSSIRLPKIFNRFV